MYKVNLPEYEVKEDQMFNAPSPAEGQRRTTSSKIKVTKKFISVPKYLQEISQICSNQLYLNEACQLEKEP